MNPWATQQSPSPFTHADEVHVWCLDLDAPPEACAELFRLLGDAEQERAVRFRFEQDRLRYVTAHAATRLLLAGYLSAQPDRLEFTAGPFGKPALGGVSTGREPGFNLAHSGRYGLLAVGHKRQLGVDIEQDRDVPDWAELAETFLCPEELACLHARPDERKAECLLRMWVRKEAVIKATGTGVSTALPLIRIRPADPQANGGHFHVASGVDPATTLHGSCFRIFDRCHGAMACEDGPPRITWRDWPVPG